MHDDDEDDGGSVQKQRVNRIRFIIMTIILHTLAPSHCRPQCPRTHRGHTTFVSPCANVCVRVYHDELALSHAGVCKLQGGWMRGRSGTEEGGEEVVADACLSGHFP